MLFRSKVYESLVKGKVVNQAGMPESFRVLIKEFQALGLDVQIIDTEDNILEVSDLENDDSADSAITIDEIDSKIIPTEEEELIIEKNIEEEDQEDPLDNLEFPGGIDEEEGDLI